MATDKPNDQLARLRKRISERLDELKISAREASRRGGFNVGYVGDLLEGRSKAPQTDKVARLAEALEMEAGELFSDGKNHSPAATSTKRQDLSVQNAGLVPLYSVRSIMDDVFLPLAPEPVGFVPTIPALAMIAGAYAFTIPNDLNAPRYFVGETVYVSPSAPPRPGDFVFARRSDGTAGVGRLIRVRGTKVTIRSLSCTGNDRPRDMEEFEAIHRIVGSVAA